MVDSQVFLAIALPFTMAPLVYFTSSKKIMGDFANPKWVAILGWISFAILTALNILSIYQQVTGG